MSENPTPAIGHDRFLIGIVVGAVALIVVGIAAVVLVGRGPAAPPADLGSPVGVVQAYVEAVRAGDLDRAYSFLSRSEQAAVSLSEYRRRFSTTARPTNTESRVLIEPVTVGSDTAEVKVTISRFSARADPFSTGTSHQEVNVRLVKQDGTWRVDQPIGPYPFLY
jgi:hypothetical protein